MTGCRWRAGGNGGGVSLRVDTRSYVSNVSMSLSKANVTSNTASGEGAGHVQGRSADGFEVGAGWGRCSGHFSVPVCGQAAAWPLYTYLTQSQLASLYWFAAFQLVPT